MSLLPPLLLRPLPALRPVGRRALAVAASLVVVALGLVGPTAAPATPTGAGRVSQAAAGGMRVELQQLGGDDGDGSNLALSEGEVVFLALVVHNDGAGDLTPFEASVALPGTDPQIATTCSWVTLAPGGTAACRVRWVVPAVLAYPSYVLHAEVRAHDGTGAERSAGADALAQHAGLVQPLSVLATDARLLDADGDGAASVGDAVRVTYHVVGDTGSGLVRVTDLVGGEQHPADGPTGPVVDAIDFISVAHDLSAADLAAGVLRVEAHATNTRYTMPFGPASEVQSDLTPFTISLATPDLPVLPPTATTSTTTGGLLVEVREVETTQAAGGEVLEGGYVLLTAKVTNVGDRDVTPYSTTLTTNDGRDQQGFACPRRRLAPGESVTCFLRATLPAASLPATSIPVQVVFSAADDTGVEHVAWGRTDVVAMPGPSPDLFVDAAGTVVEDRDGDGAISVGDALLMRYQVVEDHDDRISTPSLVEQRPDGSDRVAAPCDSYAPLFCAAPARLLTGADLAAGAVELLVEAEKTEWQGNRASPTHLTLRSGLVDVTVDLATLAATPVTTTTSTTTPATTTSTTATSTTAAATTSTTVRRATTSTSTPDDVVLGPSTSVDLPLATTPAPSSSTTSEVRVTAPISSVSGAGPRSGGEGSTAVRGSTLARTGIDLRSLLSSAAVLVVSGTLVVRGARRRHA
ncbi:hypothetical protein KSP35_03905 [Aquihabitans sp. G128]|uniref:hypothetical protein n=1 Tax=Aquihabitans sp. G128 TaxID=2849779 RepID=UPI001C243ED2|nr:hypothetical protein [Aquihabitans sp. G128]QXC61974.1 hypothetical protein KSP35_03905 [Aquihabitans sp. G128]